MDSDIQQHGKQDGIQAGKQVGKGHKRLKIYAIEVIYQLTSCWSDVCQKIMQLLCKDEFLQTLDSVSLVISKKLSSSWLLSVEESMGNYSGK